MIGFLQDDFRRAIQAEIAKKTEYLAAGKAENYDRYQLVVGEIRGLRQSLDIMASVVKTHGDIDDE